ncbi:hypothetical protein Pcinc_020376 [Petrolisthes cinctipes]|uniref:Protein kinase domain-containing protein n=1 Tax=Petrolisthes cinctipes TaxID=88211 RepID=A0AAE1KJ62_PETCI|nr:hypothetical protein Pcinc_020376 [Petrolisthes cinctipes]
MDSSVGTFKKESRKCKFESLLQPFSVLLDKIKIIRELDRGSSGEVKIAEYKGQIVCVKMGFDPSLVNNYIREASILFKLRGVGGVPLLYTAASDYPLIVMEYVRGRTLLDIFRKLTKVDIPFVIDLFYKLGRSLSYLHLAGYIHNDVNYNNIIFESKSEIVRIIDLGVCCPNGTVGHISKQDMKPAQKMQMFKLFSHFAPEVYFGLASTPAGDVFSLGRMLEELIEDIEMKSMIRDLPMGLRLMVANMVHVLPEKRPSLVTVIKVLRAYVPNLSRQIEQEVQESLNEQLSAEGSEVLEEEDRRSDEVYDTDEQYSSAEGSEVLEEEGRLSDEVYDTYEPYSSAEGSVVLEEDLLPSDEQYVTDVQYTSFDGSMLQEEDDEYVTDVQYTSAEGSRLQEEEGLLSNEQYDTDEQDWLNEDNLM